MPTWNTVRPSKSILAASTLRTIQIARITMVLPWLNVVQGCVSLVEVEDYTGISSLLVWKLATLAPIEARSFSSRLV